MGIKSGPGTGIRIRDEQPGSYFRELKKQFFGLKYLNSLMWILDPGWKKFGSGIEKKVGAGIPDKHPGSATLQTCMRIRNLIRGTTEELQGVKANPGYSVS
jgi:hypothetical protein